MRGVFKRDGRRYVVTVGLGLAGLMLALAALDPSDLWVAAVLAGLVVAHRLLSLADFDVRRLALGVRVMRAIRRGEIVMHYQPKLSLATGQLLGVEALARWQHRQHGLLTPDRWMAGAELPWVERRFLRYTLDAALHQAHRWRSEDDLDLVVCVNVSPSCFVDRRFPRDLREAMDRAGVGSAQVQIELTEISLDLSNDTVESARALNAMGVGLALDDFGVGHSSMDRLAQLPISEIKIDRRFVHRQTTSARDAAIVRGAIDLGKALGLSVTAEGVETQHDLDVLHRNDCDTVQGFFFSPAIPAGEVVCWARTRTPAPRPRMRERRQRRRRTHDALGA
jgi:EAL domain-containing protein (putative c-di-GMP-specific phosphodiesterase class I)